MISVRPRLRFALALLLASLTLTSAADEVPLPLAVELPNLSGQPQLERELDKLRELGFDRFWLHTNQVLQDPLSESRRPTESLERLRRWQRASGEKRAPEWLLSVRPHQAHGGDLALSDREMTRQLVQLAKRWKAEMGGRHFVLSFVAQPQSNREIRDLLAYGKEATAAQLDLVRRVAAKLPRSIQLYYQPNEMTTEALLQLAPRLPRRVGVVWSGPAAVSTEILERDAVALSVALGRRPLVLRDLFPANQSEGRMPLSVNLGPITGREAAIREKLSMHLSVPMDSWAASRLSLATVADWASLGPTYEPKGSLATARDRLAGSDEAAREALKTQTLEWGGPLLSRNWHRADLDSPAAIASQLKDPARLASWRYVLTRYPERIAAMRRLEDPSFRDALLEVMARRLAIARALVPVQELRARQSAGRADLAPLVDEIERLRRVTSPLSARVALDRFLIAAGVAPLLRPAEGED